MCIRDSHDNTSLTIQFPDKLLKRLEIRGQVWNVKGVYNNLSTRAENCYSAFPLGDINTYCVHVIKRMDLWMKSDTDLKVMMPYPSRYLGHKGTVETYYYYHLVQEIFETIRRKDKISSRVIPEVNMKKTDYDHLFISKTRDFLNIYLPK